MKEEHIQRIVEALRKVPDTGSEHNIYQIIEANRVPQKIEIIPQSGRIIKVAVDNRKPATTIN